MPAPRRRRLATVLFLDIVGSTALAAELGDRRFRDLFTRFWQVVRAELKRCGGREQDPAGDGLAATFTEPAQALRAAAAIAAAVQTLGVDVRAGIHTGECEVVDGKLRGLAVHIGARVMALAGPAELLVTSTVHDLITGSDVESEEHGVHTLRGVPGRWQLHRVTAVDATHLPAALTSDEAQARTSAVRSRRRAPRGRRLTLLTAAALGAIGMAIATPLLTLGQSDRAAANELGLVSLLRLDAKSGRVTKLIRDRDVSSKPYQLDVEAGTLWQREPDPTQPVIHSLMAERDAESGRVLRRISVASDEINADVGFGSVWVLRDVIGAAVIERIDSLSGRHLATIDLSDAPVTQTGSSLAVLPKAVWLLDVDGRMTAIDPRTNRRSGTYPAAHGSGRWRPAFGLYPAFGRIWYLSYDSQHLIRFDTGTHRTREFPLSQPVADIAAGSALWRTTGRFWGVTRRTLWLLDAAGATLTPMNPDSGERAASIGIAGTPKMVISSRGIVWVAAGSVVERIDPSIEPPRRTLIPMPQGFSAGNVAADPTSGAIWVGNLVSATGRGLPSR